MGKHDESWRRVLAFPNLVELTLHEPTTEQLAAIGGILSVQRLRITHAHPQTLDFIRPMRALEELVLEYVSGSSDLTPVGALPNLRTLHMENLRRVSSFCGLAASTSLKCLAIYGTTDWEQPIDDFEFLRGLPQMELLALWQVKCRAPYPAMLPAIHLHQLKRLRVHRSYLATDEYALLEEALRGVEGVGCKQRLLPLVGEGLAFLLAQRSVATGTWPGCVSASGCRPRRAATCVRRC